MTERLPGVLSKLPPALFTIITGVVILWLTLAPKPLGEHPPQLFPGADKLAHGLMFGGLTAMMLFDWQRVHQWERASWGMATLYATAVTFFGIFIECAQNLMQQGRGFEWGDILADTIGAFTFAILWMLLQKYWLRIIPK
ncbi:MAG: VanZ family protein [Muribaculaceae bacterium]|nr:VanZ family protein [Muribaculaceae bacterium]